MDLKKYAFLFFAGFLGSAYPTFAGQGTLPDNSTNTYNNLKTWDKTLMVRIKPEFRTLVSSGRFAHEKAVQVFNQLQVNSFKPNFPHRSAPDRLFYANGEKTPDMSLIFRLHYQNETSLKEAIRVLMNTGLFEYAEPRYIRTISYVPNDPMVGQAYHLDSIQAFQAWDITKGDTNVVVGIVDSGVQWTHPDLKGNIKTYAADLINGIDDDGDGKIDNVRGWDFCGPTFDAEYIGDNDPNITQAGGSHGTHVAGISAAKTDNGIGVAGIAFNCKLMPIKCAPDNAGNGIYFGYEGIEYAATHGAAVVNCSWGGEGGYSTFEQETITDATLTYNCLVVAAAGNDNSQANFYPAYYQHVLSVSALGPNNTHANFTNYNYSVRVGAPGVTIRSTYYNNSYQNSDGTSMASPVVAGVAALVKSAFPTMTPDQIAQRIRVTADNIYTASGNTNPSVFGKYGRGIVNAYRAVSNEQVPGIKALSYTITDGNNDTWQPGDSISISGNFINMLQASSPNLKVKFSLVAGPNTGYVVLNQPTAEYTLGVMEPNATKNMDDKPFKFFIKTTTPADKDINIRVYFSDGAYYDYDHITIRLNPSYINVEKNNISTTLTSKGRIGYSGDGATDGIGFQYKRKQLTYEMGLISGTSATKLANTLRPAAAGAGVYDNDYRSLQTVREVFPPMAANFEYENIMSDANAAGSQSNIDIRQKSFVWTTPEDSNYVIVKYLIKNKSASPLTNFFIGLYSDFDISANGQADHARWSAAQRMGYIRNTGNGGLFAGIALLGTDNPNFNAIENDAVDPTDFGVYDGFTDAEKFLSISGGLADSTAGLTTPKDVSISVGAGPFTIAGNDTLEVAFALVAGENLAELVAAADEAQDQWDEVTSSKPSIESAEFRIFPNPAHRELYLSSKHAKASVQLINSLGQSLLITPEYVGNDLWKLDVAACTPGLYTLKLTDGRAQKVVIQ